MKKKLLTIVVVVSMIFCMLPFGLVLSSAAGAETENESAMGYCGPADGATGTWGSSVSWAYANGILYINGTGPMGDFVRDQTPWEAFRDRITTITVAEGVTSVGANAFADIAAMTSDGTLVTLNVSLPSTLETIGDDAFAGCVSLLQIGLPGNLTTLGNAAFQNSGLVQIGLPDSVSMLGTHVFDGCTSLSAVSLSPAVYIIPDYAFAGCTALTAVQIPEGVVAITESAFANSGLTAIVVPYMTRSVGKTAFVGCTSLTDIGTSSMDPIFDTSDFDITSAVRIHGPEGSAVAQTVADLNAQGYALSYTTEAMPEITYPAVQPVTFTPVMVQDGQIYSAYGNTDAAAMQIDSTDLAGTAASEAELAASQVTDTAGAETDVTTDAAATDGRTADTSTYIDENGETVIDNSAEALSSRRRMGVMRAASADAVSSGSIENSALEWEVAADGTLRISGSGAMENYTAASEQPWVSLKDNISSIAVATGVTAIGDYAFSDLTNVTYVQLMDDTIKTIGKNAFSGCTGLTEIEIPKSVTSVGASAFSGCSAAKKVTANSATTTFDTANPSLPAGTASSPVYIYGYSTSGIKTYFDSRWQADNLRFSPLSGQPMIGITLNTTSLTMQPAGVATLKLSPNPTDADNLSSVSWDPVDPTVLYVTKNSSNQTKATVLALKAGSTAVQVTATDAEGNTYTATCTVTVSGSKVAMTGVAITPTSASIQVGATADLTLNLTPTGATNLASVTWTSSTPANATVAVSDSDEKTATVTGVKAGTSTITATATDSSGNSFTASIPVTVIVPMTGIRLSQTKATMVQDTTMTLTALTVPDGAYDLKSVAWKSSNDKVATVSGGQVKAVAGTGSAIITATATSTSNATYTATCDVTVTDGIAGATAVLKKAIVTLGNQNAVVSGVTSSSVYVASAIKAIDDLAKKTKGVTIASGKGLTDAITVAQTNSRTLDPVVKYIATHANTGSSVTLAVLPRFNIEVKSATTGSAVYMITPTYDVTAKIGTAAAVTVSTGNAMKITGTVTVTLPISDDLAGKNTALYITHKASGGDKYYKGSVKGGILTFENPDGFSEFDVTVAKPDGYKEEGTNGEAVVDKLKTAIYRLYNKLNGDHIFTASKAERDILAMFGWRSEGTPITAATEAGTANVPVYRLYNKKTGEHFLTTNQSERTTLTAAGWRDEGIVWYAAASGKHPVYRLYNKHGFHHYTSNDFERGFLMGLGWKNEGIVFYQTD